MESVGGVPAWLLVDGTPAEWSAVVDDAPAMPPLVGVVPVSSGDVPEADVVPSSPTVVEPSALSGFSVLTLVLVGGTAVVTAGGALDCVVAPA